MLAMISDGYLSSAVRLSAMSGVPASIRKIVVYGNPVLHERAAEVTDFGDALRTLIDDLFATLAVAEGVGLAAPQIGVPLRVFVYDCPDATGQRQRGHVVNPVLTVGGEKIEGDEGCLSVPGPYHELERSAEATVTGVDMHGVPIEVHGTGYFARCLQHETDHLDGILYVDHLPRNRRRKVLRDMDPYEWNDA